MYRHEGAFQDTLPLAALSFDTEFPPCASRSESNFNSEGIVVSERKRPTFRFFQYSKYRPGHTNEVADGLSRYNFDDVHYENFPLLPPSRFSEKALKSLKYDTGNVVI